MSGTIVRLHFIGGVFLRQIAERVDLSYDQVRQPYQAGVRHLKRALTAHHA